MIGRFSDGQIEGEMGWGVEDRQDREETKEGKGRRIEIGREFVLFMLEYNTGI